MGEVVGELLPVAVVIAIGPIQIIGVLLLLFSRLATANSLTFLGGWIVGLTTVSAIAVILERPVLQLANGSASMVGAILQLGLGVGLIVLSIRKLRSRPGPNETAELPGWMASLDSVEPGKALGLGLLLSAPSPKVLLLTLAAMLTVTEAGLYGSDLVLAVAIFVIVSSISVIVPVVATLLLGERAIEPLLAARTWLESNYTVIVVVILFVIGGSKPCVVEHGLEPPSSRKRAMRGPGHGALGESPQTFDCLTSL